MKELTKTFIKIDNWGEMELVYLVDTVMSLKSMGTWKFEKWVPTPALIDKNGKVARPYIGQSFDPQYIDLVPSGWTHDHCEICTKTISDKDNYDDWATQGYKLKNNWICEECFALFMMTDNLDQELMKYQRIEK
ncbi:MAG: hypothetical protein WDO15_19650 [Bacteroidota bacterium]